MSLNLRWVASIMILTGLGGRLKTLLLQTVIIAVAISAGATCNAHCNAHMAGAGRCDGELQP